MEMVWGWLIIKWYKWFEDDENCLRLDEKGLKLDANGLRLMIMIWGWWQGFEDDKNDLRMMRMVLGWWELF